MDDYLNQRLDLLRQANLFRDPADAAARAAAQQAAAQLGMRFLDASSNNYLDLPASLSGIDQAPLGAGASRLVQGTHRAHLELESDFARWVAQPHALLFSSGFAANLGLLQALGAEGTAIISDELNHASIIDGCRLSRAQTLVYRHLDLLDAERALREASGAQQRWLITESYFSMDGDGPDLVALRALCNRYSAHLLVDEAHALGVFGAAGAGRLQEHAVAADVVVGACGKSLGSAGAFVAGSETLRTFLWNRARSFVFSTAPSPILAALTRAQLPLVQHADAARGVLRLHSQRLRERLGAAQLQIPAASFGPILSVIVGENLAALQLAQRLRQRGVLAHAIRPPTVPLGTARLRLTLKASWSALDVERLAQEVIEACRDL